MGDDGDVDPTGDRVWRDIERENDTSMTDEEADAITALVADLPPAKQVDFVLDVLEKVQAERDELRADLKMERDINLASGCPDCGVHDGCYRVVVERDRLRTVVDAVRGYLSVADVEDDESDVHVALREILAELDASPTGEGT
jgi:hypothetical protein